MALAKHKAAKRLPCSSFSCALAQGWSKSDKKCKPAAQTSLVTLAELANIFFRNYSPLFLHQPTSRNSRHFFNVFFLNRDTQNNVNEIRTTDFEIEILKIKPLYFIFRWCNLNELQLTNWQK